MVLGNNHELSNSESTCSGWACVRLIAYGMWPAWSATNPVSAPSHGKDTMDDATSDDEVGLRPLPEPRPLANDEQRLLQRVLELHGRPARDPGMLRVVSVCSCGCRSLGIEDGAAGEPGRNTYDAEGGGVEVIVHEIDGQIEELEVWTGEHGPVELPDPAMLRHTQQDGPAQQCSAPRGPSARRSRSSAPQGDRGGPEGRRTWTPPGTESSRRDATQPVTRVDAERDNAVLQAPVKPRLTASREPSITAVPGSFTEDTNTREPLRSRDVVMRG